MDFAFFSASFINAGHFGLVQVHLISIANALLSKSWTGPRTRKASYATLSLLKHTSHMSRTPTISLPALTCVAGNSNIL